MRRAILSTASVILFIASGIGATAASAATTQPAVRAASGANLAVKQAAVPTATGAAFKIVVTNRGPDPATSVVVNEALHGAGITNVAVGSHPTATCKKVVIAGADAARHCALDSLDVGAKWALIVHVDGGPAGAAISGTVDATAAETDPHTANNKVITPSQYGPLADVALTFVGGPGPDNGDAVQVATVTNLGPDVASGLGLDVASTAGTFAPYPDAGSCAASTPPSGDAVAMHCTLGSLAVGQQWRVRVVVSGQNAQLFTATAQADTTGSRDPNSENDGAIVDATFAPVRRFASPGTEWLTFNGNQSIARGSFRVKSESVANNVLDAVVYPTPTLSVPPHGTVFDFEVVHLADDGSTYLDTQFVKGQVFEYDGGGTTAEIKIAFVKARATVACTIGAAAQNDDCLLPVTAVTLQLPAAFPHDTLESLTLTAVDVLGQRVHAYGGTVDFSATDPGATLPASYTFNAADHGTHTFPVTFATPGFQVLSVVDSADNLSAGAGLLIA